MHLICFSHAGGIGSYYLPMKKLNQYGIHVTPFEYAGRGRKFNQPFYKNQKDAVSRIYKELFPEGVKDEYVFFGHSMGAIIAYEMAVEMIRRDEGNRLKAIFVSGSAPPSYVGRAQFDIDDDQQVIRYMDSLGEFDHRILDYKDLFNIVMKTVKADLHLVDSYQYSLTEKPMNVPLALFYSSEDTSLPEKDVMDHWSDFTSDYLGTEIFKGNHFYIKENWKQIVNCIQKYLERCEMN